MRSMMLFAALLVMSGCFVDGANGENGVVRFSQMVNYKETDGFDAHIAQGRTILVRLEHADTQADPQLRQSGYPELKLELDGNGRVFPLGFGQFAVQLDDAGDAALIAKEDGKELDRLKVKVAPIHALRFSPTGNVTTILHGTSSTCIRGSEVQLADFILRSNQSLKVDAIPLDDEGKPMIGFLSVSAKADGDAVVLDTPLFYEGGAPNTLVVGAGQQLGDTVKITAHEESGADATFALETQDGEAEGVCN